ncbi:MAG: endonuclease domain-containing protein [Dehalococcoidia bacterium]|nr:endonuclease domain-containing protein [Dehalococcoidia bacterium]
MNPILTPNARELRKNMTPQERHLWYDFLRTYPVRVMRQRVIGRFIADFYCAKAKLVIELDGSQHFSKDGMHYDVEREQFMQSFGITTIRYTNSEIDKQFEAVCNDIDMQIKSRVG